MSNTNVSAEFFARTDLNARFGIESAEDLWTWVTGGAGKPLQRETVPVPTGPEVAYRGQSDAAHGLTSSLYRLCRNALTGSVYETDMARAEQEIIKTMRGEGLGRLMTDGQLLTVLQHHGIPTRLIDFSKKPLEALFFAVEKKDATDGRLYIVQSPPESQRMKIDLDDSSSFRLPWHDANYGNTRASSEWTETAAIVSAGDRDPRMVAQRGVFLVGGLNRCYTGRTMSLPDRNLLADEFPDVTSVGVNFRTRVSNGSQYWPAHGWTVRISASWKPELRARLEALDDKISFDSMYPPVTEVKRLATYVTEQILSEGRTS